MEYVLSAVWTAMEVVSFLLVYGAFFEKRDFKKGHILILTVIWGVPQVFTFTGVGAELFLQACSLVLYFIAIRTMFIGGWYQQAIVVMLSYYFGFVVDAIILIGSGTIFEMNMDELIQRKIMYSTIIFISKLISILIAWILNMYRKTRRYQPIERKWLLLMLTFPVASLSMLMIMFDKTRNASDLSIGDVMFTVVLVFANIALFYLFSLMEKSAMEARNAALLNQRMEMQTDSVKALEKSYREQRRTVHEFKNQLQVINSLLAGGNPCEAEAYIHQLQSVQNTRTLAVNSRHPIMDAVLNHKYQTAVEKGIDVQMQVSDLSKLKLNTDMLVVLLSNLWNNAIEACERLGNERVIRCSIIMEETLFISVSNTSLPVNIIGDAIPTTKENRLDHGYGIPQIKSIMKALNAEHTFSYENGWFTFACEIPLD